MSTYIIVEQLFNCQVERWLKRNNLLQSLTFEQIFNYHWNMDNIGNATIYELSDFFKVIGDITRIKILISLEEKEMCVGELAEKLVMTKSAVSHQLKTLRSAKLVRAEKRGKNVFYALSDYHVKALLETALEHVCE